MMPRTALAGFLYATCASLAVLYAADAPIVPGGRALVSAAGTALSQLSATPASGNGAVVQDVTVPSGGDLQAAINSANMGDTIRLAAGATFTGNFMLPAKTGTGVITIRSSASDTALPASGTRIDPSNAALLPKLQSPNSSPVLATAPGAHGYTVRFIEFLPNFQGYYDVITLGDGSSAQNTLASVPHDLIIDACYIHGDPTYGQKRGIALNSASTSVINSYIAGIKADGQDSQAIGGWNGPGPFTITNNYLEAAGENILFGGADPRIPSLVPSNITIRRNHFTKQLIWQSQGNWSVKNLLELKNAKNVVIDGNLMEYEWPSAQNGTAVLFTPRNDEGTCVWCIVQNVQFTNNLVRHTASGINILGTDNYQTSGFADGITIRNNVFQDVGGIWGGDGRFLMIGDGARNVTVDHNTVLQTGWSVIFAYGVPMPSFAFTNNIVPDLSWAIMGDGTSAGNGTIATYFPAGRFLGDVIAGSDPSAYPTGDFYPASMSAVGFVDLAGGNYRLRTTSPYYRHATDALDIGCNIDALNAALGGSPPPASPMNLQIS
jgi:hypothetical protein